VPIGEAMVACVIAEHYLRQGGQMGERFLVAIPAG
jgi:chorismate synthase